MTGQYGHITHNFHRTENGVAKGAPDDINAGQEHHADQTGGANDFHFIHNPLDDVPEISHFSNRGEAPDSYEATHGSNSEPQNAEGWNRFAQSFLK